MNAREGWRATPGTITRSGVGWSSAEGGTAVRERSAACISVLPEDWRANRLPSEETPKSVVERLAEEVTNWFGTFEFQTAMGPPGAAPKATKTRSPAAVP